MEHPNLSPLLRLKYISKGYITTIGCVILFQNLGYTLKTESNIKDNKLCDDCNLTEPTTTTQSLVSETIIPTSFTEEFIERRIGRYVDFIELLTKYTSICPIQDSCGVGIDPTLLYYDEHYPNVTDCFRCTCDIHCISYGNCCPGSHFGYLDYKCVNTQLYPKDSNQSFYMVGSCLDNYTDNITVVELCSKDLAPCTGTVSKIPYKNKHCGLCNKEPECNPWEIAVECGNADEFEKQMKSFTSHLDMKKALEENDCRVKFETTDYFLGRDCSYPKNDILSITRVDKCNVSGLWEYYNADIDWACTNFFTPYKQFKNVFCYICNPSHANIQNVSLIDTCGSLTNHAVSIACSTMPVSKRFAPFKNIFCYVCNRGYDLMYDEKMPSLQNIEEENNLNLLTRIELNIQLKGDNTFDQFQNFISKFISYHFSVTKYKLPPITDHYYDNITKLQAFENIFTSVCGTGLLCFRERERNITHKTYSNPVCKTCICGSMCAEMESCCPDILLTRQPYSCYNSNMFPTFHQSKTEHFQVKTSFEREGKLKLNRYKTIEQCLHDNVQINIKEKCEAEADITDRLSLIPVSTQAGITYKNIYCYKCNSNESSMTLKFQALCNSFIEHKLFTNLNHLLNVIKHQCQKIAFVPKENKLCTDNYDVEVAALIRGEKFVRRELHPSQFEFKTKTFVEFKKSDQNRTLRTVFGSCNKTGHYTDTGSDLTKTICESENINIMSLPEYRIDNKVFKNFACFLCNQEHDVSTVYSNNVTSMCLSDNSTEWFEPNADLEELCNITEYYPRWYPFKNMYCAQCNLPPWQYIYVHVTETMVSPAAGYKYIFSLSINDFKHLDEVMETEKIPDCNDGSYDYFWKQCRPLNCFKGFRLVNFTCEPVLESILRHEYEVSFNLHIEDKSIPLTSDSNSTNKSLILNYETLSNAIVNDILFSFDKRTGYFLKQTEYSISPCERVDNGGAFKNENYVDLAKMDIMNIQFTVQILKSENIANVQTILLHALNRRFNVTDILDIDGEPHTIHLYSNKAKLEERQESPFILFLGCKHVQYFGNGDSSEYTHFFVDEFLTCGHVKLNSSKVCKDVETNNMSLKGTNNSFTDLEYKIIDKKVIICGDLYSERSFIEPAKVMVTRTVAIKSVFIIFSIICTIVSLLCLFFTFVTYCLISSLRTVAGKNIMSLCISLFFSQALLQFGINATSDHTLCVAIGIAVHLSWLMSFCAMNVCSFHTFKVFHYNNNANNMYQNKHSKSKLFLKYIIYIICLPLSLVVTTLSISLVKSDATDAGYGKFYCFISDFLTFILTFIAPACFLFLSNIVFFSLAFHKIRCTPKTNSSRDRNNFCICLKLFTIVGIAWPLLIIDTLFGITWFSFIVAGVNSLQGVFIFVSFVLNRRVASLILSSIFKMSEAPMISINTNNTKSSPIRNRNKTDGVINTKM